MAIRHVLVVGAGQMGAGIAQVLASAGLDVSLFDSAPGAAAKALMQIDERLVRAEEKGGPSAASSTSRIAVLDDSRPFPAADLLIEAVVESSEVKEAVFRRADAELPAHAVLASNTSSIPIATLARVTGRPDRVIGMHFFNPVPVLQLVEVIPGPQTARTTTTAVLELARAIGKEPVEAADVAGFVANRILMPFINEAVLALADGVAEAEAIDTVARLGFGHPLGPLALADLIGLDTCVAIMDVLAAGLNNPRYAPHALLREHVASGRLGRKSGAGFYSYGSR